MLKAAAVILLSLAVLKKGGSLVLKVILALLCLSVFLFVGQVLFFCCRPGPGAERRSPARPLILVNGLRPGMRI